eukprot:5233596-Pyramimonas_sp.AAC.1
MPAETGGRASDGWRGATLDRADKNDNGEVQGYYVHVSRHQNITGHTKTWQWLCLNEYSDKFKRDSGAPSTLPEPPPPPTPKARPPEKGP